MVVVGMMLGALQGKAKPVNGIVTVALRVVTHSIVRKLRILAVNYSQPFGITN